MATLYSQRLGGLRDRQEYSEAAGNANWWNAQAPATGELAPAGGNIDRRLQAKKIITNLGENATRHMVDMANQDAAERRARESEIRDWARLALDEKRYNQEYNRGLEETRARWADRQADRSMRDQARQDELSKNTAERQDTNQWRNAQMNRWGVEDARSTRGEQSELMKNRANLDIKLLESGIDPSQIPSIRDSIMPWIEPKQNEGLPTTAPLSGAPMTFNAPAPSQDTAVMTNPNTTYGDASTGAVPINLPFAPPVTQAPVPLQNMGTPNTEQFGIPPTYSAQPEQRYDDFGRPTDQWGNRIGGMSLSAQHGLNAAGAPMPEQSASAIPATRPALSTEPQHYEPEQGVSPTAPQQTPTNPWAGVQIPTKDTWKPNNIGQSQWGAYVAGASKPPYNIAPDTFMNPTSPLYGSKDTLTQKGILLRDTLNLFGQNPAYKNSTPEELLPLALTHLGLYDGGGNTASIDETTKAEALEWIKANPNDPRAAAIKQTLGVK